MSQIERNKAELWADIRELANMPLNAATAAKLTDSMAAYYVLCRVAKYIGEQSIHEDTENFEDDEDPAFSSQMAVEWAESLQNADGTRGPHFSREKAREIQRQYGVDCDPVLFWAVINSLYSDYDEALKKNNASTTEMYACLAKAWIKDEDAVPDKAAAYYRYIVQH